MHVRSLELPTRAKSASQNWLFLDPAGISETGTGLKNNLNFLVNEALMRD